MIQMPYIYVDIIFSIFGPLYFIIMCIALTHTTLKKYEIKSQKIKDHKWKYFYGITASTLLIFSGVLYLSRENNNFFLFSEVCLYGGLIISVYLLYGYINKHYFKKTTGVKRNVIVFLLAFLTPFILLILFSITITVMFVIK